MSMSNSETATHQFIDASVDEVYVEGGVVTLYPRGDFALIDLSKEDLLHLLKLIEETN